MEKLQNSHQGQLGNKLSHTCPGGGNLESQIFVSAFATIQSSRTNLTT